MDERCDDYFIQADKEEELWVHTPKSIRTPILGFEPGHVFDKSNLLIAQHTDLKIKSRALQILFECKFLPWFGIYFLFLCQVFDHMRLKYAIHVYTLQCLNIDHVW